MRDNKKSQVKSALRKAGVIPSKQRGQNFLIDQSFVTEIVKLAKTDLSGPIVEIGPGLGALTSELAAAKDLTLIEIEPEFCKELGNRYPNAKIINQDVREVDFSQIGSDLLIFGNLPYSFSTEIIFSLIDNRNSISKAVLLLQQEFAERMASGPGGRIYGVLSISAQIWCNISLGAIIKGDAFMPPTKVNSRLVVLEFVKEPKFRIDNFKFFKKIVKASFLQRRKKLINSLLASGIMDKIKLLSAMEICGIDSNRRAETLSIQEFITLADSIEKNL